MAKYIFRMDRSYPDEGVDKDILESHDGKLCEADLDGQKFVTPLCTVLVRFLDGYENMAFVYELEQVNP